VSASRSLGSQLVSTAQQEALGNGVLKDSSITAAALKDPQGQPLISKFSYVPKLHRDFVLSLYGLPALIVLSALGVTFASKSKRVGLRRLCLTLLTTGIYSLAIALAMVWLLNHVANSLGSQAAGLEAVQGKAVKVVELLVADLRKWWFGSASVTLALVCLGCWPCISLNPNYGRPLWTTIHSGTI